MMAERLTPWGGVCKGREALARMVVAGPPRPRGSLAFPPRGDLSPGTGPSHGPCGFLCCTLSPDHFHSSGSNEALPLAEKAPYLEEIPVELPTISASCGLADPGHSTCLQFPALALVGWCTTGLLQEASTMTGPPLHIGLLSVCIALGPPLRIGLLSACISLGHGHLV